MIIKECIDCAIGNKEKVASCPDDDVDDDDLAIELTMMMMIAQ